MRPLRPAQAAHLATVFGDDVAVIGLHTVFEHHEAMGPASLEAFVAQYGIRFPVGIDAHEPPDPEPVTFGAYGMRGHQAGVVDDMVLAAAVTRLVDEHGG